MLIKCIPPLHIGLISPQICTDLRGQKSVENRRKSAYIGGKEYTLDFSAVVRLMTIVRTQPETAARGWEAGGLLYAHT